MNVPASIVERFSRGEAITVGVDRIESELTALWQAASRAAGGAGEAGAPSPVARAALWNIVIPTHGPGSLAQTKRMVDELAPSVPARVIMLARNAGDGDGNGAGTDTTRIEATIESNVVSRPSGARVVYSEEITLTGHRDGDGHFGALVRSLQIPGLPTATLWIDTTSVEELLTHDLLPLSDRLVLDTGRCGRPDELIAVARFINADDRNRTPGPDGARRRGDRRVEVGDLGWLRLAGFRLLFAGLFDPPVGGAPLADARTVTIQHRPGASTSALVLGGWLADRLGWAPLRAARADDGPSIRFAAAATSTSGGEIELRLRPTGGECGTSGIVALTLETASGATYAVRRVTDNHAEVSAPDVPSRLIKLDSRADAELCVGALGPGGRDPLLARVLASAGRLAELVEGGSAE